MPTSESLAARGKRLQDTALERQSKVYAPDVLLKIRVEASDRRIEASFVDNVSPILAQGERVNLTLRLENIGARDIGEAWLVPGNTDEIWLDDEQENPG